MARLRKSEWVWPFLLGGYEPFFPMGKTCNKQRIRQLENGCFAKRPFMLNLFQQSTKNIFHILLIYNYLRTFALGCPSLIKRRAFVSPNDAVKRRVLCRFSCKPSSIKTPANKLAKTMYYFIDINTPMLIPPVETRHATSPIANNHTIIYSK